jgi:hypothetical protein
MPIPKVKQFALSEEDKTRLGLLIEQDYTDDSTDYQQRNSALKRWYKLWRNAMELQGFPDQETPNFSIPLCLWVIKAALAKEMDALFGEESEIAVNPIGKTDTQRVDKVRRWINWRVKKSLKLYRLFYDYILQKKVFGTTIGFVAWKTEKRTVREVVTETVIEERQQIDPQTQLPMIVPVAVPKTREVEKDVIDFDGPCFDVENIEDYVIPANAKTLDKCDHFIRILRLTTDEILDLVDEGKLDKSAVEEHWERLRHLSENTSPDDSGRAGVQTEITDEKKLQDGLPTTPEGREEKVRIHNWFGRFRTEKDDEKKTPTRTQEIVAFYQPDTKTVLGVCRLVDIFPDGRRPQVMSQNIRDTNKIWGIGLCELLEPINKEMDALHNLGLEAGAGAIGPVVFGTLASGFNAEKQKLEPFTFVNVADPNGIKVVNLGQIQFAPFIALMNMLQGFAERVSAITDPQLGRQQATPNAPRTLGQQQLLQMESNTLLLLDIRLERESMRELLQRIWDMDKRWLPKPFFFRVTEEDPGDVLSAEDMMGEYDFDIGPVTAVSNRAQKMQEMLQCLQLLFQSQITPAYAALLKEYVTKQGYPAVAKLIPDMSQMAPPMTPEEEASVVVQGQQAPLHPMDNHAAKAAFLEDYAARIEATNFPGGINAETLNPGVVGRLRAQAALHMQAAKQGGGMGMAMQQAALPAAKPANMNLAQNMGGNGDAGRAMVSSLMNSGGLNLG